MYKIHGVVDLDFDKLFNTLSNIKPMYRSEWGVDYWDKDRDNIEQATKTQYTEQSASYWQYVNLEIDRLIPQDIFDQFDLDRNNTEIKVLKYPPGSFTPPHVDRFNSLKTRFNLENTNNIVRVWIAMENPKFGHALFFENDVVHNVPRGTMITWDHSARHSACNAGLEDRYIMTITGVVNS